MKHFGHRMPDEEARTNRRSAVAQQALVVRATCGQTRRTRSARGRKNEYMGSAVHEAGKGVISTQQVASDEELLG